MYKHKSCPSCGVYTRKTQKGRSCDSPGCPFNKRPERLAEALKKQDTAIQSYHQKITGKGATQIV